MARGEGPRRLELRLRGVEIAHAVSAEGGLLSRFTPDGYAFLPESALDRTVRVASVHVRARSELGRGLSLDARVAARRSDPGWRDQFWMTPFESQVRLGVGRAFFAERLRLRGYVEAGWVGQRATPNGILDPRDRYDAGIEGEIADFRVDFQFVNLEGDLTEASGYDGGWMVLPLGSIRMGLVWRFVD
ncbi:MAG: hypothetical protein IPK72_06530 [Candidatus Eisenbacteria bacterium]|nr:hypothetical protein [Candidatus Eisenbacteria bacterium]